MQNMKSIIVYRTLWFLTFLFFSFNISAAVIPADGAHLNHTQVMFEYNEVKGADEYLVTITSDPYMVGDVNAVSFEISNKSLAVLLKQGLHFGRNYKWNFQAFKNKQLLFKSPEYHFSIDYHPFVDPNLYRFTVKSKPGLYNDNVIFLDNLGIAIDRQGNPVWFLNDKKFDGSKEPALRNIQLTGDGTITYLDNTNAVEISLSGDTLWKAPNDGKVSRGKSEFYHHDFTKLYDGSYLVGGYFFQNEKGFYNPSNIVNARYNTIIQYDVNGNVTWSWNEKDHVAREMIYRYSNADATNVEGTHLNGFSFDSATNSIIASFRNNSSVFKIDKKTGRVVYDWGKHNVVKQKTDTNFWFFRQHGPVVMRNGNVLIYNNNVVDDEKAVTFPRILIVNQPLQNDQSKKIWEYEIKIPELPGGHKGKEGYALELPNGNILVCIGGLNKIFEITLDREVVWECTFEKYSPEENKWKPFTNYRTNVASSLYPRFFTLTQLNPVITGSYLKGIVLHNDGTEKDNYTIDISDAGKKIGSVNISLGAKEFTSLEIPVKKMQSTSLSIHVYPALNPQNVKSYMIKLN